MDKNDAFFRSTLNGANLEFDCWVYTACCSLSQTYLKPSIKTLGFRLLRQRLKNLGVLVRVSKLKVFSPRKKLEAPLKLTIWMHVESREALGEVAKVAKRSYAMAVARKLSNHQATRLACRRRF